MYAFYVRYIYFISGSILFFNSLYRRVVYTANSSVNIPALAISKGKVVDESGGSYCGGGGAGESGWDTPVCIS